MYNYPTNNFTKTPSYITSPPPILKGHPVSGLEEVRATSIDFDGSVFYFPDLANKRIYTKAIGNDGSAYLNMYEQRPLPQDTPLTGDFITRQEFEKVISDLTTAIQSSTKTPSKNSSNTYKGEF